MLRGEWFRRFLAFLLVALSATLALWGQSPDSSGSEFDALPELWKLPRPLPGILLPGFPYRARATSDNASGPRLELLRFEARLGQIGNESDGVAPLARAFLSAHKGLVDDAVGELQKALIRAPRSAATWSALSAVYLGRGTEKAQSWDLVLALSAAETATTFEPAMFEAQFNRALALQALQLDLMAGRAWTVLLESSSDPQWQVEIRRHQAAAGDSPQATYWSDADRIIDRWIANPRLAETVAELASEVGKQPQSAREFVQKKGFRRWAELFSKGQHRDAEAILELLEVVTEAIRTVNQDAMTANALAAIREARKQGNEALLAGAHRLFASGVDAYEKQRFSEARDFWNRARSAFRGASDLTTAGWAGVWANICDFTLLRDRSGYPAILEDLAAIQSEVEGLGARSILGRISWLKALSTSVLGDFSTAGSLYRNAVRIYRELGEFRNEVRMRSQLASVLEYQGASEDAWSQKLEAIRLGKSLNDEGTILDLLSSSAKLMLSHGQNRVGLSILDELIERLGDSRNSLLLINAHLARARILLALGRHLPARTDLRKSRELTGRLQDPEMTAGYLADIQIVEAIAEAEEHPEAALEHLNQAYRAHEQAGYSVRQLEILLHRSRVYHSLANLPGQEQDLKRAIEWVQERRGQFENREEARVFLETSREIFEEMIRFQALVKLDRARALQYAECGRLLGIEESAGLDQPQIPMVPQQRSCESLPGLFDSEGFRKSLDGLDVIEFRVLAEGVLAWLLQSARIVSMQFVPIERDELQQRVERLGLAAREPARDDAAFKQAAAELYQLLLQPLALPQESRRPLLVVADGSLYNLDFGSLWNPRSESYVIEQRPVLAAHSVAIRFDRERSFRKPVEAPRLVLAADPSFDLEANSRLERLPGSRQEAEAIAALYPNSASILAGRDLTAEAFLTSARTADVVHFAGHAIARSQDGGVPGLVLAPSAETPSGRLGLARLDKSDFQRPSLVVLSACSSAFGVLSFSEGPLSLVGPFLQQGVPAVIATLWNLPDRQAADLFRSFYRELVQSVPPAVALQRAKIAAIHSTQRTSPSPRGWAGIQIYVSLP